MPDLQYSPFLATFETPATFAFSPVVALSGGSDMSALAPLLGGLSEAAGATRPTYEYTAQVRAFPACLPCDLIGHEARKRQTSNMSQNPPRIV